MNYTIICHSGVKGMKWGERHYQNKDGSLTPLGKIRRRQEDSGKKKEAARINKKQSKKHPVSEKPKEKSVKDMTDEELKTKTDRLRAEKAYTDLAPVHVSAGKKFAKAVGTKFMEKSADAVADLAAQALKEMGAKGINSALSGVFKEVDESGKALSYVYSNNKKK